MTPHALNKIKDTAKFLGIVLAMEKLEGPSHCLTFFGIVFATQKMQARLPKDKFRHIKSQLSTSLHQMKTINKEILSLVGLLSKVVRPGRTFVARMYSTAAKVNKKMKYFSRLNRGFRSDLHWWNTFINNWNGIIFLCSTNPIFEHHACTDASSAQRALDVVCQPLGPVTIFIRMVCS